MGRRVDIAVAALVRGGRLLLVHRHPGREHYPDCWDLPGGHVEPGESPLDAVRRECHEELGVEVVAAEPLPVACSNPLLRKHAFVVTAWDGVPVNLAPEEHDDLRWFTSREIASLTISDPAARADLVSCCDGGEPAGTAAPGDRSTGRSGAPTAVCGS